MSRVAGAPFFIGDLALNLLDVLLVALGVPLGAAVAARFALTGWCSPRSE